MSDSDIIIGIVTSVVAVVLASVTLAYTVQTQPPVVQKGSMVDGTRQFLLWVSSITLVLVVIYWIVTGIRNRERIARLTGLSSLNL